MEWDTLQPSCKQWLCQSLAVHDSRVLTETLQGLETSETLMYEFVCSFPVRISPPFVVTACPDPNLPLTLLHPVFNYIKHKAVVYCCIHLEPMRSEAQFFFRSESHISAVPMPAA